MSHSLLIEVMEVPWGHDLGENYLFCAAACVMACASALTQCWALGQERNMQSLSFLICKERLNDFPKIIQLISERLRVRILICGIAAGIPMRQFLLCALQGA